MNVLVGLLNLYAFFTLRRARCASVIPCFVLFFVVDVGGSFREEGVLLLLVLKEKGVHNIQAGFHPRFFSFFFACQRSEHDTCLAESKDLLESWEVDFSFLPGM